MANKPNNPALWSRAKSLAKQKFDVYPSAYANGWAAKWYKGKGGSWRKAEYGMEVMGDGGTPNNPGFNALPEEVQEKIIANMGYGGGYYNPLMASGGEKMPPEIARARFAAAGNLDKMGDYGYAYGGYVPEMMYGGDQYMQQGGQKDQIMQIIQAYAQMNQIDPEQLMQQLQKMPAEQQQQAFEQMVQTVQQASQPQPDMMQAAMMYGGYTTGMFAEGGEPNGGMALGQMSAVSDKMSKLRQFVSPEQNLDPWIASKLAVMDDSADAISDYMMYNPEAQQNGEQGLSMEQMMRGGGYVVTRSSNRKGKTHKVTGPDGTVKYFGDSNLGQHPKDPQRKAAFYARHKKNLAGNPYFRAFARKTWEEGGEIPEMREGGYYDYDGNFQQAVGSGTMSGNAYYDMGGELPMAEIGLFNPGIYPQFGQPQPTSATYDASTGMINSPNGVVTRNDTRQFGFSDSGLYVKDEAKNLQNTLSTGSAKDIRQGVKGFNQNFGTSLNTPGIVIGKKGRDAMQTVGAYSDVAKMGIGMASLATDLFINNPAAKKDYRQLMMNQGMTDALNMAAPEDRGDYVATGSRIGQLRPDQYVVNKGMYTGQFMPTMNMMQFGGTGMIEDENPLPLGMIPTPNTSLPAAYNSTGPISAENTMPANFKLTGNFEDYATKAEKYIRSVNPKTDVTGEMLAAGAQMAFEKTGKLVPVELALAQLQQEGYLAKGKQNRPQRTKNPFNVGNTDNGSSIYHNDLQGGINTYYNLLTTRYLNKRSPEQLLENFVNGAGNRYASDKNYETSLKKIVNQVQNRVFEEGGVYDLSEDEIKSILSSGGNVEFI